MNKSYAFTLHSDNAPKGGPFFVENLLMFSDNKLPWRGEDMTFPNTITNVVVRLKNGKTLVGSFKITKEDAMWVSFTITAMNLDEEIQFNGRLHVHTHRFEITTFSDLTTKSSDIESISFNMNVGVIPPIDEPVKRYQFKDSPGGTIIINSRGVDMFHVSETSSGFIISGLTYGTPTLHSDYGNSLEDVIRTLNLSRLDETEFRETFNKKFSETIKINIYKPFQGSISGNLYITVDGFVKQLGLNLGTFNIAHLNGFIDILDTQYGRRELSDSVREYLVEWDKEVKETRLSLIRGDTRMVAKLDMKKIDELGTALLAPPDQTICYDRHDLLKIINNMSVSQLNSISDIIVKKIIDIVGTTEFKYTQEQRLNMLKIKHPEIHSAVLILGLDEEVTNKVLNKHGIPKTGADTFND